MLGCVAGLPVPVLIIWAPAWGWIIAANALLGVNHGLCWSMTAIMKVDLVGPRQRGLAVGPNEFAGYLAVSLTAFLTGYLATLYGLRPVPFFALPLLLGSLGIARAWLGGLALLGRQHRPKLLAVAVIGLVGGGMLLWHRSTAAACTPSAVCSWRMPTALITGVLSLGAILTALGFVFA